MKEKDLKILAIETSCDETAAAVIGVEENYPKVLSNIVSTQVDLHAKTGGVVPEVASRAHMESIVPVISEALFELVPEDKRDSGKAIEILQKDIDYIAITVGPGLIGSLLVGFNAAKSIAYALNKPVIPVNHIEGHIYSAFAEEGQNIANIKFPILALTVSGGHTSLTLMKNHGEYENIGQTIDDAAGEAFDKVAKLLDLGYPGGPIVSKLASQFRKQQETSDKRQEGLSLVTRHSLLKFPRPILNDGTFNFSFSGLKTAVLQHVLNMNKERELTDDDKQEICASFEDAVVDVLATKAIRAAKQYGPKTIILAGGVAANNALRTELESRLNNTCPEVQFLVPSMKLCGDNAVMIGIAAYYHIQKNQISSWDQIKVDSNFEL